MARPSRTGGKISEAKARNASPGKGHENTKTKRRSAPTAGRVKRRSVSGPSKDLKAARKQQAATAEILKVIASSPDDVQPVVEAVAERAMSLLDAWSVDVTRFDGELLLFGAARGARTPRHRAVSPQPVTAAPGSCRVWGALHSGAVCDQCFGRAGRSKSANPRSCAHAWVSSGIVRAHAAGWPTDRRDYRNAP